MRRNGTAMFFLLPGPSMETHGFRLPLCFPSFSSRTVRSISPWRCLQSCLCVVDIIHRWNVLPNAHRKPSSVFGSWKIRVPALSSSVLSIPALGCYRFLFVSSKQLSVFCLAEARLTFACRGKVNEKIVQPVTPWLGEIKFCYYYIFVFVVHFLGAIVMK